MKDLAVLRWVKSGLIELLPTGLQALFRFGILGAAFSYSYPLSWGATLNIDLAGNLVAPTNFFGTNLLPGVGVAFTNKGGGKLEVSATGDSGGTNARQFGSVLLSNLVAGGLSPVVATNLSVVASGLEAVALSVTNLPGTVTNLVEFMVSNGFGLKILSNGAVVVRAKSAWPGRSLDVGVDTGSGNYVNLLVGGVVVAETSATIGGELIVSPVAVGGQLHFNNRSGDGLTYFSRSNLTGGKLLTLLSNGIVVGANATGYRGVLSNFAEVLVISNASVSATGRLGYLQVSNISYYAGQSFLNGAVNTNGLTNWGALLVAGQAFTRGLVNTNGLTNNGALLCAGPAFFTSTYSTNFSTNRTFVFLSVPYSGTTNLAVVGPVTNQWDFTLADWKAMTNNLGQRTNHCFQFTNLVPGGFQRTVVYGNASGTPTNEFFTNWLTCPTPATARISWLGGHVTNGFYDFVVRTNRAVVLEAWCDRATNLFVRASFTSNNWALP